MAADPDKVIEEGVFYISGDRWLLKVREPERVVAWMKRRDVRIHCFGESESIYTSGDVVTSAGGIKWTARYESYYVPHRMMCMGMGLWGRVDYNILRDAPAGPPSRALAVTVQEGKQWRGRLVDEVAVVYGRTDVPELGPWIARYYFDPDNPGLLLGGTVSKRDEEPAVVHVLMSYEVFPNGHWYPTLVVAGPPSPGEPSMYEVVKVTRLEASEPPADVFRITVRGQFRLPELGHHAIVYLKEDTIVEADRLGEFASGLAELLPATVRPPAGSPLLPGVAAQPLPSQGGGPGLSGSLALAMATAAATVILLWVLFLRRRRVSNG